MIQDGCLKDDIKGPYPPAVRKAVKLLMDPPPLIAHVEAQAAPQVAELSHATISTVFWFGHLTPQVHGMRDMLWLLACRKTHLRLPSRRGKQKQKRQSHNSPRRRLAATRRYCRRYHEACNDSNV